MYGTVCPLSDCAQFNGWCVREGISWLFSTADVGILVDADALTLGVGHVLTDTAPEFAATALRTIAERHHIGQARPIFNHDLAELTAL